MKFFFDTEFVEDGRTIDLISIAIVAEDGRSYYAVNSGFDRAKAENHPFVNENVLPLIRAVPAIRQKPKYVIAREIKEFVGDKPEFWADYASYDWVALCQLYGTMMDLPDGWPMFCRDIQQLAEDNLSPGTELPQSKNEHDALSDANNALDRYLFILS